MQGAGCRVQGRHGTLRNVINLAFQLTACAWMRRVCLNHATTSKSAAAGNGHHGCRTSEAVGAPIAARLGGYVPAAFLVDPNLRSHVLCIQTMSDVCAETCTNTRQRTPFHPHFWQPSSQLSMLDLSSHFLCSSRQSYCFHLTST